MSFFQGAARQSQRQHTPRNMAHVVAIHIALAAHQGVRCTCRDGLLINSEKGVWQTCIQCHGFGKLQGAQQ